MRVEVWFQDEARIGQKNTLTRVGGQTGSRPAAPNDLGCASAYVFGALGRFRPAQGKAAARGARTGRRPTWRAKRCGSASGNRRCLPRCRRPRRTAQSTPCTIASRLSGMVLMANMMLDEVVVGALGSGLFRNLLSITRQFPCQTRRLPRNLAHRPRRPKRDPGSAFSHCLASTDRNTAMRSTFSPDRRSIVAAGRQVADLQLGRRRHHQPDFDRKGLQGWRAVRREATLPQTAWKAERE